jgi:hypothetical protein
MNVLSRTFRTTRLLGHVESLISEETIREIRLWGKTRFADGIVMAKTGHEAGRMEMHPYPAPTAGTGLTPRSPVFATLRRGKRGRSRRPSSYAKATEDK